MKQTRKNVIAMGGISFQHQELKVHKNGAKFTISKSYLDDGLLDENKLYTMFLIPETRFEGIDDDLLAGVEIKEVSYKIMGDVVASLKLPLLGTNTYSMMATFPLPVGKAQKLLPDKKNLVPVEHKPGMAAIAINCTQFKDVRDCEERDSTLYKFNPYNATNICILVRFKDLIGYWVYDLRVTCPMQALGAKQMNNFPVTHEADITFRKEEVFQYCDLGRGKKRQFSLKVRVLPTEEKNVEHHFLSSVEAGLQTFRERAKGDVGTSTFHGDAELTLGEHGMGPVLKSLSIGSEPISVMCIENARTVSGPPELLE